MFPTTTLRPTEVSLRDYQIEAINAIRHSLYKDEHDSTLLILPTGTGKTVTFGMIARRVAERGGRTLILAHRGELIEQAVEHLVMLGMDVGVEKADSYARTISDPHAVVATVQTMQGKRLATWPKDYFRLIVTDEAHHAPAATYGNIYSHFDAKHLGVTATADRADDENLGQVFQSVAFQYSLWDAMTATNPGPYLSRVKFVQCDVGIDLRDIRTTAGDLNAADLEAAITPHIETLANAIRQEIGSRKLLVFTPDVGSAMAMASALHAIGIDSQYVSGDDPERKDKVAQFKQGAFQALCNCALLTEGFDAPDIGAVALCRPTKSRALYAQMVGRGTRLAPGKTDCLLIDFNWLTAKHQLVKPAELFDTGTIDTETLEIADELLKGSKGLDLRDVVEQAEAEKERRTVLRIKAREKEVRYRKVSYDPITAMESLGLPLRREADRFAGTATPKQIETLGKFGLTGLDSCSKRSAGALLDAMFARRDAGLATIKQVSHMIRNGVDPSMAREMKFADASSALDRIFSGKS
jgi:superfamily II DNA or RNA helicase